jgi:tetratricopeptide (TPR) repeat protein
MARVSLFGCLVFVFAFNLCAQQMPDAEKNAASGPSAQQPSEKAPLEKESSVPVDLTLPRVAPPPEDASARELEQQGDSLRGQKLYLDSVDYYRAAVKKDDSAALHNKIGISLLLLRRDSEARHEFEHAIRMDKAYPEAHNNLGALFYNSRRFGPAIKEYKKAIKLSSENASFHSNLGTAYFSEKNFEDATREYQRAMQIDPGIFDRQPSGGVSVKLITSNDLGHFHYVMAQMYGQHNNADRCRYYLSKANEEGYPTRDALRDSVFATLRNDPEFVSFLRSLKNPSPN